MIHVYVLRSKVDGGLYTGQTIDLWKRISEHNSGKTLSTKGRRPFELLYSETVGSRSEARCLEKKFKSGYMREIFKEMVTSG